MIVTMIGPIHPRMPLDGIGGTSRAGSEASSRRGASSCAVGSGRGWASAAGSVSASAASAGGAVPVTGPS